MAAYKDYFWMCVCNVVRVLVLSQLAAAAPCVSMGCTEYKTATETNFASVEEVENVLLFMATMYTLYTFQQRGVQEGVTRKNQHLSTVTNKGGLKVNHMNVGELH